MRTFSVGDGEDRKFVILEIQGSRLRVTKGNADGTTKRSEKDLSSEVAAHSASDQMARELMARGYVERNSHVPPKRAEVARGVASTSTSKASSSSKQVSSRSRSDGLDIGLLAEAGEGSSGSAEAFLPRLAPAPAAAEAAPPKKKASNKKKKKKRKGGEGGDELDKRVIAAIGAAAVVCVAFVGFLGYEAFLKPPSIIGHWEGSKTEHEIGKFIRNTQYRLILDDRKNVSMSIQEGAPAAGTYALQGDRLKLTLKDEDGETSEVQYKVTLGGSTLDLYDVETGNKLVQLIRFRKKPSAGGGGKATTPDAPKDIAAGPVDKAADDLLASVPFAAKDGAFGLKQPPGWEMETGSRPDNTYSWVRLTKGSAKIQVFADIAGSLMAGPSITNNNEEGSELAPVHGAHLAYKRNATELYSDYKESEPALFKGSGIGEGRVATFTASTGGVFGSKVRGLRITLLTNDRRISILCEAPPTEFEKLKPTFLATARSLSR